DDLRGVVVGVRRGVLLLVGLGREEVRIVLPRVEVLVDHVADGARGGGVVGITLFGAALRGNTRTSIVVVIASRKENGETQDRRQKCSKTRSRIHGGSLSPWPPNWHTKLSSSLPTAVSSRGPERRICRRAAFEALVMETIPRLRQNHAFGSAESAGRRRGSPAFSSATSPSKCSSSAFIPGQPPIARGPASPAWGPAGPLTPDRSGNANAPCPAASTSA